MIMKINKLLPILKKVNIIQIHYIVKLIMIKEFLSKMSRINSFSHLIINKNNHSEFLIFTPNLSYIFFNAFSKD